MQPNNRLSHLILMHWKTQRPHMVAQLEISNTLGEAVSQAETRASDRLFELVSVQKMQYGQAWELAMEECLLPEEPKSTTSSPSGSPPSISG